jgi:hypothetical protein
LKSAKPPPSTNASVLTWNVRAAAASMGAVPARRGLCDDVPNVLEDIAGDRHPAGLEPDLRQLMADPAGVGVDRGAREQLLPL